VFNGTLCTVAAIDLEEEEVVVLFVERQIHYNYANLSELAWAITITSHRDPVIVILLFMQPCLLLSRKLLYTA